MSTNKIQILGSLNVPIEIDRNSLFDIDICDVVEKREASINFYKPIPIKNWVDKYEFTVPNDGFCYTIMPIVAGKTYTTSDMINIVGGLSFAADTNVVAIDAIYDVKFSDDGTCMGVITFTVPNGVNYIIVSTLKGNWAGNGKFEDAIRALNSALMIVEGNDMPWEYVPYVSPYKLKDNVEVSNIPTKLSELENDEKYITLDDILPELPEVTKADNGKVLMVDNGTWQVRSLDK